MHEKNLGLAEKGLGPDQPMSLEIRQDLAEAYLAAGPAPARPSALPRVLGPGEPEAGPRTSEDCRANGSPWTRADRATEVG